MTIPNKAKKNIPKPTHFGKNLKFLRRMSGLNQTELAAKLDMSRNNIASYESGLVEPNMKKFLSACIFFEIDPKDMLDSVLSENIKEISHLETVKPVDEYVSDQIEQFVIQTNEMTKVFEGYKTFFQMKKEMEGYEANKELHSILEDLLELLQTLISSNWKLIQSVYPSEGES